MIKIMSINTDIAIKIPGSGPDQNKYLMGTAWPIRILPIPLEIHSVIFALSQLHENHFK